MLGNDLVDLLDAGAKQHDTRFIERVFTQSEQKIIHSAVNPNLVLWMIWAAKESLYKLATKDDHLIFAHKEFALSEDALEKIVSLPSTGECFSQTYFGNQIVYLQWNWNPDYVHCVASLNRAGIVSRVRPLKESASGEVRGLAKELVLENSGYQDIEILRLKETQREMPPAVYSGGQICSEINLSLTHDGRFIAAAVQV